MTTGAAIEYILLNACEAPEVSCNEVYGANNGYPDLGQAGVRNFSSNAPLISCNTVDRTTNGMLFSGWSLNTDIKGNSFGYHRWGLHLEYGAQIGTQLLKGNLWLQAAPGNGYQAWHENAANAVLQQFLVDQGVPNTDPPSREPINWFQPATGNTFNCYEGLGECVGYKLRCTGCPNGIYESIADSTLENGDYTEQTRWALQGDLYDILRQAPELQDDPELEAFYNAVQSTVIGALRDMNDERIALYDIDSTVLAQLLQNRQQLLVLQVELKLALEQLALPNLTETEKAALRAAINGLQLDLKDLITYNTTAMQLTADSRVLTAESLGNANAAIGGTVLMSANYKAVNDVYLNAVAKDIDGFTEQQAQSVFAVANQCPLIGGNAVFFARSLYYLVDLEQEFDDPALCLQQGLITKSIKESTAANAMSVIPNPASDAATLVLSAPLDEGGTLTILNALGMMVQQVRIPTDMQRVDFGTSELSPGVYHIIVRSLNEQVGTSRMSIIR